MVGQPDDRVADQLAGAVEGDLAAAVDVDDRRAAGRPAARAGSVRLPAVKTGGCSSSSTVSGAAGDDLGVDLALQVPGGDVVDGLVAEADGLEGQVCHAPEPTPAPRDADGAVGPACGKNVEPRSPAARGREPQRGRPRCRTPAPSARTSGPGRSKRWVLPVVVVLLWLFVGGPLGSFAGRLSEVQKNDNASFLPKSAESTRVLNEFLGFTGRESLPTTVVFERPGGLTGADKQAIAALRRDAQGRGPRRRRPRSAAAVVLRRRDGRAGRRAGRLLGRRARSRRRRRHPRRGDSPPGGLTALVGGQGGILGDFITAFGAIDGILLVVALLVILVILVVVYRTIILPLVVMLSAVLALGVASAAIYVLAKQRRPRPERRRARASCSSSRWAPPPTTRCCSSPGSGRSCATRSRCTSRCGAPTDGPSSRSLASGVTVILGLLCLLLSDLSSLRGLGPVGAIGIAGAMFSRADPAAGGAAAARALGLLAVPADVRLRAQATRARPLGGVARLVGRRARTGLGGDRSLGAARRARRSCRPSTRTRCRRPTRS